MPVVGGGRMVVADCVERIVTLAYEAAEETADEMIATVRRWRREGGDA